MHTIDTILLSQLLIIMKKGHTKFEAYRVQFFLERWNKYKKRIIMYNVCPLNKHHLDQLTAIVMTWDFVEYQIDYFKKF